LGWEFFVWLGFLWGLNRNDTANPKVRWAIQDIGSLLALDVLCSSRLQVDIIDHSPLQVTRVVHRAWMDVEGPANLLSVKMAGLVASKLHCGR
jgi:hypothetical protein